MTRYELEQMIDTKLSTMGTLDESDIINFGLLHRELPLQEKDWGWLCKKVKWHGSKDSLRKFIARRASGEVCTSCDDATSNEKHELYKERQKLRDERTALNALLRDDARVERFREELQEEARKLSSLPIVKYVSKKIQGDAEAVALLSDLHLGMQIDELCNTYNLEIAQKRLDKWTEDVIRYCKSNHVRRLNVVNLGDLIQGEIHPSIRIMQELDVASQVIKAGEFIARALNRLQEAAPEVIYRSVSDNHSRFMPDLHQSIERENFFRLIDWWLEARLENTKIKWPKDNVNFRTGKFRLMSGKLCMFEHGHCLKPNQTFQDLIGLVEEYVHYVFLGHYHSEKMKTFQNMRVYINGSICGTDPYAESIHKYTKPKQTLLVFDGDNVINFSIDLDIRD